MGDQDLSQRLGGSLEIKGKCINDSSRNLVWKKVMEAQAKKIWNEKMNGVRGSDSRRGRNLSVTKIRRNPTRSTGLKVVKRRRLRRVGQDQGSGRDGTNTIEKKVRTLKKLIPNGEASIGLDGLFRETAEYISNLEVRVRIMRVLVDALSSSNSN